MKVYIDNLRWVGNFNGYELGFDRVPVVAVYTSDELNCDLHIDTETGRALEIIPHEEEME